MNLQKIQEILLENSIFDIEITTRCNKDCWMCPRESLTRKKEDMNEKVFHYLVNWLPKNASIFLAGFGEPTLHPLLPTFVKKLAQNDISCCLITNGKKLDLSFMNILFENGLNQLKISFILPEETPLVHKFLPIITPRFLEKTKLIFLGKETCTEIDHLKQVLEKQNYKIEYKKIHNRGGLLYPLHNNNLITCGTFFKVTYINVKGEI